MFKRRPEYFAVAVIGGIMTIAASVFMAMSLNTGISEPDRRSMKKADEIVVRAAALTGSTDEEIKIAKSHVEDGLISCGDYVISVMTSPEYLLQNVSDEKFARDLCYVVSGSADQGEINDILDDLKDNSRIVAINKAIRSEDSDLKASGDPSGKGSVISDVSLAASFDAPGEYTVGIKETTGSYTATGDEVRTDFFVDGSLFYGYLKYDDNASKNGYREFVLSWDTADCAPGTHEVYALLRSSDGRGTVISGGEITIPEKLTISPGSVAESNIPAGRNISWYIIDCAEDNCYINFAGLSADIKVSLYSLKGELIGTNENPGIPYAMLRGAKQNTQAISEETGIAGISNCYYICVSRTGNSLNTDEDVYYTMIQTRECAYFDGMYMAVTGDENADKVKLTDLNKNTYEVERKKAGIVPINGALSGLYITDNATADSVNLYPKFDYLTRDYAYYLEGSKSIYFICSALEGYSAQITIRADNGGQSKTIEQGQPFEIPAGETLITCTITSFDGTTGCYSFYILNGDDTGNFVESTLSNFPKSYYSGLWLLHNLKPNYIFTAYYTGVSFDAALAAEDSKGRSLLQNSSYPDYVKPNSQVYDKPDWMAAKTEVVSYYLDPRNFFTPQRIFAFEMLGFDPSVHTVEGVREIIRGSFMDNDPTYDYAQLIYDAGKNAGVSPYFLASRIIQEMGYSGESALSRGEVTGFEGYYNFYNIGAYATTEPGGAVINGAKYAQWGRDWEAQEITETEASFLLPWTSVDKAISGGALWIASGYIEKGQNTLYFQKFDVLNDGTERYNHQYAQNIMMAYSEGLRYYRSYDAIGMTDAAFEFIIPVYDNMPQTYGSLPS
ncbi:MAG: hypothetical protein IKS75_04040 [Clostridiales bacterium]|nr:hypothetical protein [Clostridiales bacterium]